MQQFEVRTVAIQENEYIPTGRLPSQFILDQTAQAIETFAHIARPWIKMVGMVRTQDKH
nr:hypothetical protein [Arenibacter sp. H213]